MKVSKFGVCLWFDTQAEEAANYYCSIFKNSKIGKIARYGEAGKEIHQAAPGSVLTVEFELDGQKFTALNEGPVFKFNEAVSLEVHCVDQAEVDFYWEALTEGGDESSQQCGWLKDKFGVSWQVIPEGLSDLLGNPDDPGSERAMTSLMNMKKLDIAELRRAHAG